MQSSGRSYSKTAHSNLQTISKNEGLALVIVQVVDEKGVPVLISEDEVTCNIEGPAALLSLKASCHSDMGYYTLQCSAYLSRATVGPGAGNRQTGTLILTFTARWLKETKVTINITK